MFLPLKYSTAHNFWLESQMYRCIEAGEDAWKQSSKFCMSYLKCYKNKWESRWSRTLNGGFRSLGLSFSVALWALSEVPQQKRLKRTPPASPNPSRCFASSSPALPPRPPSHSHGLCDSCGVEMTEINFHFYSDIWNPRAGSFPCSFWVTEGIIFRFFFSRPLSGGRQKDEISFFQTTTSQLTQNLPSLQTKLSHCLTL